jgi:hypothetical protein
MSNFSAFPFSTTAAGAVDRTLATRLSDVFNVKDFGAVGNGIANDQPAIQAAVNSATGPGNAVVFFPPGIYQVNSRITMPLFSKIILKGCGADVASGGGSILQANFNDYILAVQPVANGRSLIALLGLGFHNSDATVPSSVIPSWAPVGPGNGGGCVYSPTGIAPFIANCDFKVNKGICLYIYAQNNWISNCTFKGEFTTGSDAYDSYGIICTSGLISNCIFRNLGFGINYGGNPGLATLDAIIVEQCGYGISLGWFPIPWYDDNNDVALPAGFNWSCGNSYANNIIMRSCSIKFFGGNLGRSIVQNINIVSDGAIGIPSVGLDAAVDNIYRNINISGLFTVAAIQLVNSTGGNTFENVSATCSGGGGVPISGITWSPGYGRSANVFRNCSGFTFAQPLHDLPIDGARPLTVLVTDSIDPAWTGSASNAGKPLGHVLATNAGSAAGESTLHFPAGLPAYITYGVMVANASNPTSIPNGTIILSGESPTGNVFLTKAVGGAAAFTSPIASGDQIVFAVGGGTNSVLALWNGFYWQMVG